MAGVEACPAPSAARAAARPSAGWFRSVCFAPQCGAIGRAESQRTTASSAGPAAVKCAFWIRAGSGPVRKLNNADSRMLRAPYRLHDCVCAGNQGPRPVQTHEQRSNSMAQRLGQRD